MKGKKKGIQNWGKRQFEKLKGGKERSRAKVDRRRGRWARTVGRREKSKGIK